MNRYEEWLLTPAGRSQRKYDFAVTERFKGRDAAVEQDERMYERDVFKAELGRVGRDAIEDFRTNGFERDF
jgi:hypothetical protein